ncbi:hypothetical protein H310_04436 [Aphanomyces invadans]|uniref:J domain-containing protein n=1 Tax=Aphanomyces invadans TaxID=157072 RepID=A0A024UEK4_9STRA|nr:hypothetical protein H310_04436 [Aphanomyces invadans]ETW04053.1 hypothetical protein H310_04436 [Aphanomyces invadans]|eukprot:XP_008867009.1 hypothetical protein H310_04436 [Aphanomyces invadans]
MSPEELTFTLVLLALYAVPSTFFVVRRVFVDPKSCLTKFFVLNFVVLVLSFFLVWQLVEAIQTSDMIAFDPYEILNIPGYSTKKSIRKAYRALSQQLHPDKSRDPLAASKFARVAKAYEALTDPTGIANYKKYGHPDGKSFHLVDFKAMSGTTGLTVIAVVYGTMLGVGILMALFTGDRYKPEINPELVERIMAGWHDKMSTFEILTRIVTGVKQPLEEKAAGNCCGGGGSLYEMDDDMKAFLVALEANKVISAIEHRDIARIDQDHIQRDVIALYYHLNQAKVQAAKDLTVPCILPPRAKDIALQLPYLLDLFVDLSTKNVSDKRSDAATIVNALRLYPSLAQGSLVADAAAVAVQRGRFPGGSKVPQLTLTDASLTVDGETDVFPKDWVTLRVTCTRQHVPTMATPAPPSLTVYDKIDKSYLYRKEHLWVVAKDVNSHALLGAWKIEDAKDGHEVSDALGFWAPSTTGNFKVEVRVFSTTYLDIEATETLPLKVISPSQQPPQSTSIFDDSDDESS